jgi:hypothetical protein
MKSKKVSKTEVYVPKKTNVVAWEDVPKKVKRLYGEYDVVIEEQARLEEERQQLLRGMLDALGTSSFNHPTDGDLTIMTRGDKIALRSKPQGAIWRVPQKTEED